MCGRFTSTTPAEDLAAYFSVDDVVAEAPGPRWNVAPTDTVLGVVGRAGARRLGGFRWGLVPSWARDPAVGSRMINARAETVTAKPAYARSFRRRRCIVPADGFYEWRARPDGRGKQAFHVRRGDGEPLAVAAVWDAWRPEPGSDEGRVVTCALLTTAPNELLRPIHDRMPVLLPPSAWDRWLDPANEDVDDLAQLLRPAPEALLEVVPVGPAVGDVRNDGPALVEPVPADELFPVG